MSKFHQKKTMLRSLLEGQDWQENFENLLDGRLEKSGSEVWLSLKELLAPLMGFLPMGGVLSWRASTALGMTVSRLVNQDIEAARIFMRRLLWHMNEDSGNIGWGIPETMGEILARHEVLAKEYYRILLSYILKTGKSDNYIDHIPLRRSAFSGIALFALSRPELALQAFESILQGLDDEDSRTRGYAAWALTPLCPLLGKEEKLRARAALLKLNGIKDLCEIFDGSDIQEKSVEKLAEEARC